MSIPSNWSSFQTFMAKCWGNSSWGKNQVKLLGITIDNELKFDDHITKICRQANSELSAVSRLARYLSMEQKKLLYISFI